MGSVEMKLSLLISSVLASDSGCTSKGGTCQDYKQTVCIAGYEQYICDGNADRRCCLPCDATCELNELESTKRDGACTDAGGNCQHDTNYCDGSYQSNMCGGGSSRKCCLQQSFNQGDYYWNHYSSYALDGYATSTNYRFSSLSQAQQKCIDLGDMCSGVTRESSSSFTVRRNYVFKKTSGYESWTKEVVWAPNFVPRAQWGAREPKDVTTFHLPAPHGVIGHHTAGHECFTLDECINNVRGTQNYHMDSRGWSDIGYNFLIGEDGRIYEGRGFYRQGAHCSNWNSQTLGFSIMGDFSYKLPNQVAIDAAQQLIEHFERKGFVNRNCYEFSGHRDHGSTVCPGDPLYALWGTYEHWHAVCQK